MLDFARFEWLSFDCYGTLIDWETGLLGYLRPLLEGKGHALSDAQILNLYSEFEPLAQGPPYRSYREVLTQVVGDFARELRFSVSAAEANGLAESIRNWQPFADTVPALRRLQSRYKLAALSNIDDDLFAYTARWSQPILIWKWRMSASWRSWRCPRGRIGRHRPERQSPRRRVEGPYGPRNHWDCPKTLSPRVPSSPHLVTRHTDSRTQEEEACRAAA
jgi:hypothetical protein